MSWGVFRTFCDEYTLRADVKGKGRDLTQWSTDPKRSKLWQKRCNVSGFGKYKMFCVTGRGYLANADVESGQAIESVFTEARFLLSVGQMSVMRRTSWLGEAYIHGFMCGEAFDL